MQYGDELYGAIFRVDPTGKRELLNNVRRAADLPIDNIVISSVGSGVVRDSQGQSAVDLDDLGIIAVASFEDD